VNDPFAHGLPCAGKKVRWRSLVRGLTDLARPGFCQPPMEIVKAIFANQK
jgi:hypothetical protein